MSQITHIHKNRNIFLKYNWNILDQPLLPYTSHARNMWGMYFFIFTTGEPFTIYVFPSIKTKKSINNMTIYAYS